MWESCRDWRKEQNQKSYCASLAAMESGMWSLEGGFNYRRAKTFLYLQCRAAPLCSKSESMPGYNRAGKAQALQSAAWALGWQGKHPRRGDQYSHLISKRVMQSVRLDQWATSDCNYCHLFQVISWSFNSGRDLTSFVFWSSLCLKLKINKHTQKNKKPTLVPGSFTEILDLLFFAHSHKLDLFHLFKRDCKQGTEKSLLSRGRFECSYF